MLTAGTIEWLARLADVSLRATVVLMAAGGLALVLRRASAATRHLVWTAAIGGVLLLPVVANWMPTLAVPILRSSPAIAPIEKPGPAFGSQALRGMSDAAADAARSPSPDASVARRTTIDTMEDGPPSSASDILAVPETTRALGFFALMFWIADGALLFARSLPAVVLLLWLTGAVVLVARLASGVARVSWITRRATAPAAATAGQITGELAQALGVKRPVAVLTSPATRIPMTWGWARPVVLVPIDAGSWSSDRLRVVLLHELAHVKRGDWATQLLAQIACAVYWFNPLVWLAARWQRVERERACDAAVLSTGTSASSYANHLLEIARSRMEPAWSSLPAVAMARHSQLEGRLLAILDPRARRTATRIGAWLAGVATIAVVLLLASVEPSARATSGAGDGVEPAVSALPAAPRLPAMQQAPPVAQPALEANPKAASAAREAAQLVEQAEREASRNAPRSGIIAGAIEQAMKALGEIDFEREIAEAMREAQRELRGTKVELEGLDGLIEAEVETALAKAGLALSSLGIQADAAADEKLIDAFLGALEDSDAEVRERAAWALGKERAARAVDALGGALKDVEPDVREQAAWALGQIRDRRAIDPLSGALRDESAEVAERAAWALGQIRDPAAVPGLVGGMGHADPDVREQVAWALGQIRDPQGVEGLVGLLNDAEPDVREQAAWALGQIRDAAAVDGLVAALDDEDADVREQIVWALGQIRDGRAVPGLLGALKDSEPDVVEQVVWALGRMRDERAKDALIAALQHEDPEVRRRVIEALTGGNWDPKPQPQPDPDPRPGAWKFDSRNPNPNVNVNVNKNVNRD